MYSPGQQISELLPTLSDQELKGLLPKSTIDIITSLYPKTMWLDCLRRTIANIPIIDLYETGKFKLFIKNLSKTKLDELARRLELPESFDLEKNYSLLMKPKYKAGLLEFWFIR